MPPKGVPLMLLAVLQVFLTQARAQTFQSPCPRLFVYEAKGVEPDRWYGLLTLLSETDLNGVWLRLMFDRPIIQLGNWFGDVDIKENNDYLVKNRDFKLTANRPEILRFFVKYNTAEPVPQLTGFRLNARMVCPEGSATPATPTAATKLRTSGEMVTVTTPRAPSAGGAFANKPNPGNGASAPNLGNGASVTDDNEYYQGDWYNKLKPTGFASARVECGTVAVQPKPLITYGNPTQPGEYPWHVALYHVKGVGLNYICGGSLISLRHVITAGHCLTKPRTAIKSNRDYLLIYLGKHDLRSWASATAQEHQIDRIIVHPEYEPSSYANDVAVVKLAKTAQYTDYVRPICLWQDSQDISSLVGKLGTVVGWGFDENGKLTDSLTQIKMPVVSKETCIYSFPDFFSRYTTTDTYCAGFKNGSSVCNGDSGGGMTFLKESKNSNRKVWHLRGLVSISVALQGEIKCDAYHYVVFTDIAKYLDFVKAAMAV